MQYIKFILISIIAVLELKCAYVPELLQEQPSEQNPQSLNITQEPCACGLEFATKKQLINHISAEHKENKKFSCPSCTHTVTRAEYLQNHMQKHKSNNTKRPSSDFYEFIDTSGYCPCGTKYSNSDNLMQHLKQQHENNICPASDCTHKRAFSNWLKLKIHIQAVHEKKRSYRCKKCLNFTAGDPAYIKRHVNICDGAQTAPGNKYLVPLSLEEKQDLQEFIQEVQDDILRKEIEKDLASCISDSPAQQSQDLEETATEQNNTQNAALGKRQFYIFIDKPGKCSCGKPYSDESEFNNHITNTHQKPDKYFYCPIEECSLDVPGMPLLKAHMRAIHEKDSRYQCITCNDFITAWPASIIEHVTNCKGPKDQRPAKRARLTQAESTLETPSYDSPSFMQIMQTLIDFNSTTNFAAQEHNR